LKLSFSIVQQVEVLSALEESYPASAKPFNSPHLSGTWSLVYSSSSNVFKAALGNKRSKLFRLTTPTQTIDASNRTVINSALLRLRLTPLKLLARQIGNYIVNKEGNGGRGSAAVEFKKGGFNKVLKLFRKGSVSVDVTYLSEAWRVCRTADGVVTAFRKMQQE
jgi:PAP_fibrillin